MNVGPIREAKILFGDLTVFIGAQATGKSIALQMLNYAVDRELVAQEMVQYGMDWGGDSLKFWDLYLGEGMRNIWMGKESVVMLGNFGGNKRGTIRAPRRPRLPEPPLREENLFYIPAQRVLTLRNGWPRPFSDYSVGDPYVVKAFSERTRVLLEKVFATSKSRNLFPQTGRLKGAIRKAIKDSIFHDFDLAVDVSGLQRRMVLRRGNVELPFMVWSAGQREFVPLLIGLYWLLPPTKTPRRGKIEWVVLEEPEMGLHPRAILALMLLVLDLMDRGYKVVISTHSGQILDLVWAIGEMQSTTPDPRLMLDAVGVNPTPRLIAVGNSAFAKHYKTYFFGIDGQVRDISALDPSSESEVEAGWGGLSEFSGTLADAVGEAAARAGRK